MLLPPALSASRTLTYPDYAKLSRPPQAVLGLDRRWTPSYSAKVSIVRRSTAVVRGERRAREVRRVDRQQRRLNAIRRVDLRLHALALDDGSSDAHALLGGIDAWIAAGHEIEDIARRLPHEQPLTHFQALRQQLRNFIGEFGHKEKV